MPLTAVALMAAVAPVGGLLLAHARHFVAQLGLHTGPVVMHDCALLPLLLQIIGAPVRRPLLQRR